MNTTLRTTAVFRAAIACAAGLVGVSAAHAVDWTGYMRGGPAATDVSGKSRQCYGIGELKYRLGNECDFYGEFQLAQAMKADGVDFNAVLMTNYYSPQTESNSNYGVEQAYVEMKGVDIAPQALFWMGKRRDRDDVHIVDTFFTNMSGVGAGVENIDVGFGKFGFSGYKTDSAAQYVDGQLSTTAAQQRRRPPARPALRHPRQPGRQAAPGGHVLEAATRKAGSRARTATASTSSTCRTSSSAAATTSGCSTRRARPTSTRASATTARTARATRRGASWKARRGRSARSAARPSRCTSTTRRRPQRRSPRSPAVSSNYWTVGGRGSYGITKNLKWLTEIGYSSLKPDGGKTENVTKVTVGPALSTGPDFWKRPELRLYVTYADYNKAAAADTNNNYGFADNKTNAVSYGAQVEIWF